MSNSFHPLTLSPLQLVILLVTLLISVSPVNGDDAAEREFTLKVLPLLKDKCLGCHGGDPSDIKGEYSIVDRDHLLGGGESGDAAVVPGRPGESPLLSAIRWENLEMPPKENDRLTSDQISTIERWIKAGAPWPDEDTQARIREEESKKAVTDEGVRFATSGGTSAEWSNRRYQPDDLWAFQPVKRLTSDDLRLLIEEGKAEDVTAANFKNQQSSIINRQSIAIIDVLVNRNLSAAGLAPVPRAQSRTLIRRATFDLHGLPPTPEEVDEFVAASEIDPVAAWESLIDRLLASPRYGERWGRHWLDVTRYADTGGMSNDYERSNMWRYRDYVIRAFNNDKPYNEFIIEQLAGDELADQSVRDRKGTEAAVHKTQLEGDYTPEEAERIIATGFLRLGPWDNAMVEKEEARQMWLDDLVNVTGQTFLSTTMRCVKCHDHKFDPIPTRDYYRIYAVFSTTHMAERPAPFLPVENKDGFETGRAHAQRMLDFAVAEKNKLVEKRETAAKEWFEEHNLPYKNEDARKNDPDEMKPPRAVGLDHVDEGQLKVREQDEWIWTRQLERYEPMAQSVFNAADFELAWNGARKLRIKRGKQPGTPPECHILTGGALTALGDVVQPGVLSAVSVSVDAGADDPYLLTEDVDGRRLGLARWIAGPANPLTTRSIVNRIWQGHFGVGLAANANNFGAKGAKPSHPELLDFLAADFVEHGWTIKRLHRLIMLSEAYQRSSAAPQDETWKSIDPNNRLLSHFPKRRLSAEEIRDGILQMTGELQERNGGLPIMPEINMEVALQPRMIQFSLAPAYQPSRTPEERNCRTIYAYNVRGQADPFTELFNQPNPNESREVRESAAVTPQVFTLLNSDQMTDRSIAFALRLQREDDRPDAQIQRAFEVVCGREVTDSEVERLSSYFHDMVAYHRQTPAQPVNYPTEITRSLVEEFSGQVFEYQEILPVFENYVPDKKPADVSPETRALADLCLLLLNSNEFMYVN
ncbi:MAG: PSD1 domain-containing protein [Planctomycetaceae bacterium]|nr:PSD1 domain-containing protein [Planctomycetaceae bacterium]